MEQALYQAAILTFEELSFVSPDENTDQTEIDEALCVRVGVGFHGTFSGELVLQIENTALSVVAANMLGEDEPVGEVLMQDVLGELANVICGNTLPLIAGKQEIFRLSTPEFHKKISSTVKPSAVARLGLEEGRADILLYLN